MTIQKLKIFEKYGGCNGDYDRVSKYDLNILPYNQFIFIDKLVQDIKLIDKGLAAPSYINQVENVINESCDSAETIAYLKHITARF